VDTGSWHALAVRQVQFARDTGALVQLQAALNLGPGGLLGRLTKVVLESALEGEMAAHLGYRKQTRTGLAAGTPATCCPG
jgi:putative transposase